jgi:hypothetical protein
VSESSGADDTKDNYLTQKKHVVRPIPVRAKIGAPRQKRRTLPVWMCHRNVCVNKDVERISRQKIGQRIRLDLCIRKSVFCLSVGEFTLSFGSRLPSILDPCSPSDREFRHDCCGCVFHESVTREIARSRSCSLEED